MGDILGRNIWYYVIFILFLCRNVLVADYN